MLPCGHHEQCMYRYRHKGITRKYCLGCIVETFPDANLDAMFKKIQAKLRAKDVKVLPPETVLKTVKNAKSK